MTQFASNEMLNAGSDATTNGSSVARAELKAIRQIPSNQMQLSLDGLETIAAAQVTHQGGRGEPFHDWYPYLEGFSSEFVKFVLAKYISNQEQTSFRHSTTICDLVFVCNKIFYYQRVSPVLNMFFQNH